MTAWDLIERYRIENGELPLPGREYEAIDEFARFLGVDTPENDSIVAVAQMLRTAQEEAMRRSGQMSLI